jgi:hypothetical protein
MNGEYGAPEWVNPLDNQLIRLPGLTLRLRSGQAPGVCLFDKLKAPSTAEGLRVDTERRFSLDSAQDGEPLR